MRSANFHELASLARMATVETHCRAIAKKTSSASPDPSGKALACTCSTSGTILSSAPSIPMMVPSVPTKTSLAKKALTIATP